MSKHAVAALVLASIGLGMAEAQPLLRQARGRRHGRGDDKDPSRERVCSRELPRIVASIVT
jgi:hypothetical protein